MLIRRVIGASVGSLMLLLASFFGPPSTRPTLTPLPQSRQSTGALFVDLPGLKGSLADHKPIPVGNSSNATLSFSTDGRLWVRKREVHTGYQSLLAKAIAWLICIDGSDRRQRARFVEQVKEIGRSSSILH